MRKTNKCQKALIFVERNINIPDCSKYFCQTLTIFFLFNNACVKMSIANGLFLFKSWKKNASTISLL